MARKAGSEHGVSSACPCSEVGAKCQGKVTALGGSLGPFLSSVDRTGCMGLDGD